MWFYEDTLLVLLFYCSFPLLLFIQGKDPCSYWAERHRVHYFSEEPYTSEVEQLKLES